MKLWTDALSSVVTIDFCNEVSSCNSTKPLQSTLTRRDSVDVDDALTVEKGNCHELPSGLAILTSYANENNVRLL